MFGGAEALTREGRPTPSTSGQTDPRAAETAGQNGCIKLRIISSNTEEA